jgi:hypothetical protein
VRTSQGRLQYYDLKENWPKVKPHLANKALTTMLVRDFNKFTYGRWRERFEHGRFPAEFESSDWQCFHRGRRPAFWKYTCSGACHWLVNFALRLAMLVEPRKPWRIITSPRHSTVWDGANTVFEFNFQAFGIEAAECLSLARKEHLRPGEYIRTYRALHYKHDRRSRRLSLPEK